MSSTALVMIQQLYAAFAKGDVPTVLGSLAADIAWTEAAGFPYGGTYHGPTAVLDGVFMRLATEWDGYAAVPSEYVDGGDTVVALGLYSGRYKATGKHFEARFAHVWKVRDGQAYQFEQFVDSLKVNEALQA
ncbi:MAG: nuclear transport factor 2 family protein [Bryobacterales bacterium]|nr:nuclear transport factor 2 family protein [Bryobacterales bacterium]